MNLERRELTKSSTLALSRVIDGTGLRL
jgi:hypothetical protein